MLTYFVYRLLLSFGGVRLDSIPRNLLVKMLLENEIWTLMSRINHRKNKVIDCMYLISQSSFTEPDLQSFLYLQLYKYVNFFLCLSIYLLFFFLHFSTNAPLLIKLRLTFQYDMRIKFICNLGPGDSQLHNEARWLGGEMCYTCCTNSAVPDSPHCMLQTLSTSCYHSGQAQLQDPPAYSFYSS